MTTEEARAREVREALQEAWDSYGAGEQGEYLPPIIFTDDEADHLIAAVRAALPVEPVSASGEVDAAAMRLVNFDREQRGLAPCAMADLYPVDQKLYLDRARAVLQPREREGEA